MIHESISGIDGLIASIYHMADDANESTLDEMVGISKDAIKEVLGS